MNTQEIRFRSIFNKYNFFDLENVPVDGFVNELYHLIDTEFSSFANDAQFIEEEADFKLEQLANKYNFEHWYDENAQNFFESEASEEIFQEYIKLYERYSNAQRATGRLEQLENFLSDALIKAQEIEQLKLASTED